jgi:hypothetical protein
MRFGSIRIQHGVWENVNQNTPDVTLQNAPSFWRLTDTTDGTVDCVNESQLQSWLASYVIVGSSLELSERLGNAYLTRYTSSGALRRLMGYDQTGRIVLSYRDSADGKLKAKRSIRSNSSGAASSRAAQGSCSGPTLRMAKCLGAQGVRKSPLPPRSWTLSHTARP